MDWLNVAIDLHRYPIRGPKKVGPNPAWDDGKALEVMWRVTLEKQLPDDDRREPYLEYNIAREILPSYDLYHRHQINDLIRTIPLRQPPATATTRASLKRFIPESFDTGDAAGQNPKKRQGVFD